MRTGVVSLWNAPMGYTVAGTPTPVVNNVVYPPIRTTTSVPTTYSNLCPDFFVVKVIVRPIIAIFTVTRPRVRPDPTRTGATTFTKPPQCLPTVRGTGSVGGFPTPIASGGTPGGAGVGAIITTVPGTRPGVPLTRGV